MTVVAYVRTSSRQPEYDCQEAEIKRWLNAHDFDPQHVDWFIDNESGERHERPALQRLQEAIFHDTVKAVVVWRLDRLSDRLHDGVNLLARWFEHDLRLISVAQEIDVASHIGRTIAAVMLGLAETEQRYLRERQATGIAEARNKGVYKGRTKGATKAKPRLARELRDQGHSVSEIAKTLGTSERTVWRYLNAATALDTMEQR